MGPSRAGGGMLHSSSSSGIFFQRDVQSPAPGNAQLGSFGNMALPSSGNMHPNMVSVSADINNVMNSIATSGPSIGGSSMVTDANSGLSGGGPHLQRSASINTESYMRLPASPLSFTSNNPSISGSSIIDGPSAVQQTSNQDPHQIQLQGHSQGAPAAAQFPPPRLPNDSRVPGSFALDHDNVSHLAKKPRLDMKQVDIMQHQVVQQLLQRQDSMQFQNPNPQLQALIQQQRLRQQQHQQQLLQSLPPVQRAQLLQQQQQLQLRQLQQQGLQPPSAMKRSYDGGVCSRRMMQYLFHQRQRPADNSIAYWRKFVAEYYSPRAKKRWCLSLYDNVGHHSLGVFPQAAVGAWQCDICGSKSGRGFEASFEVLPRLNEIKFSSGVVDELLYLDWPRESRFPSGLMVLEYGKAVQESIYEQLRVVRQGQLKVIFTPDLKILTWEFCARRHEELIPRQLVLPQVNQLLQVAQKCQSTISEGGSDGPSQQDLQTNSNMIMTAWRQLARTLELQSLNDLGFSKRYVRCLQISEVVSSMKDLMDYCQDSKAGPVEGLKNFPRQVSMAKSQIQQRQEMEQGSSLPGLPTDRTALVAMQPGINSPGHNTSQQISARGASPQSALTLSNYQSLLMRQRSMNSNSQLESPYINNSNQNGSFQGLVNQNNRVSGGFPNAHLLQQQPPSQGGSQAAQHHMIQQLLQEMNNNNNNNGGVGPKPSVSGQSGASGGVGMYGNMMSHPNGPGGSSGGPVVGPTRSNSFKGPAHSDSSAGIAVTSQKVAGLSHLSEDIVPDLPSEFTENGFFNNDDFEDGMGYGWK